MPKVQSFGINKDYLIKLHQEMLGDLIQRQNLNPSQEQLDELSEISILQSRAILFGRDEITDEKNKAVQWILSNLPKDYEGLNQYIAKTSQNRSYEDYTGFILNILKSTSKYFKRSLDSVQTTEAEQKFEQIISEFEQFLESQYTDALLPLLLQMEAEIREALDEIYNSNLDDEEAIKAANDFLEEKKQEYLEQFEGELQEVLNDEAIELALAALLALGFDKPAQAVINKSKNIFKQGLLSNIRAFFFNEIRRVQETVFDNLSLGVRSLAQDQLNDMSFNKNTFKLSMLTHPRALFRNIISISSPTDNYKAIISYNLIDNLNPKGNTSQVLYKIKTKEEWARTSGLKNVNVVDGMSLHHNDQIYYYPVIDMDIEEPIAKAQRKEFVGGL